jgi:uncharacterized damage-inducible protein DinB
VAANSNSLNSLAFADLDRELTVTRTVLERLPDDQYAWKPHEKSMSLGALALHVAELPQWARFALAQDVLDFATMESPPKEVKTRGELLARFDHNTARLRQAVAAFDPAKWNDDWTMRNGGQIIVTKPRAIVYRVWSINHLINHRAQLCLYLRLLNLPVPVCYFNSADEPAWVFE